MRDNRTGSIFYPNYTVGSTLTGNDQVVVGDVIDTKETTEELLAQ